MSTVLERRTNRVRWDEVKRKADGLTAEYSVPPIPVAEIAEFQGTQVVLIDFGRYKDRVAGFCDFAEGKIYVNSDDISVRQSFTIAHELGHWLLHKHLFSEDPAAYPVLPRFQRTDENNPLEKEANHFAANLLVPDRLLKPVKNAPVAALAGIFQVSKTMMEFRVKNVG